MFQEILKAFTLIFIAEMGDKTQILAMAFATRYPVKKVLLGIGIGAFLNHGLAVLLGSLLSNFIPINTLQLVAGIAFVGFAIWSLKIEEDDEEETPKFQFGPVVTIALAFFIGELGDKTQLTAITLASDATYPAFILVGTVLGMIATGFIGILIGRTLGDKVPEIAIKIFAACIFLIFGIQKLSQTVPTQFLTVYWILPVLSILFGTIGFMIYKLLDHKRKGIASEYVAAAKALYAYYHHIQDDLEGICLGTEYCETCQGGACPVGKAKQIVQLELNKEADVSASKSDVSTSQHNLNSKSDINERFKEKAFNKESVIDSLADTLMMLSKNVDATRDSQLNELRKQLELLIFHVTIEEFTTVEAYLAQIREMDSSSTDKIEVYLNSTV